MDEETFNAEEFQFALEMIIVNRNENGATLTEIGDDYKKYFGITFESMFGYRWSGHIRSLLVNTMTNIFTRTVPHGCTLFFMDLGAFKRKLLSINNEMEWIVNQLNIDPQNIKPYRGEKSHKQRFAKSHVNSGPSRVCLPSTAYGFYNHTLISDDLFLELSNIDLQRPKIIKNQVERIGLCVSGQTLKAAYRTISYSTYNIPTKKVILNIGTFDLLNGRRLTDMQTDIINLLNVLKEKNIIPILTTLAPLPNREDLDGLDDKRQSFNTFLRNNFDLIIDVEKCFLSNEKRVLVECYQPGPKAVSGSKQLITLWNRVGRQRVVQLMKQELPYLQLSVIH